MTRACRDEQPSDLVMRALVDTLVQENLEAFADRVQLCPPVGLSGETVQAGEQWCRIDLPGGWVCFRACPVGALQAYRLSRPQSLRTLACRDVPERTYLKLALSIVNTSTSRSLAPHTVGNAPRISDWLRGVVTGDGYLHDELRLILLGEVMGVAVDPVPVSGLVREDAYGALACIWRQSLHIHLDPRSRRCDVRAGDKGLPRRDVVLPVSPGRPGAVPGACRDTGSPHQPQLLH